MLSPSDHCLRPVRSLLSFLGPRQQHPVPLRLPRSYATNNNSGIPPTLQDEPLRTASAPPEAQINGLGLVAQPVASTSVPAIQPPLLPSSNRHALSPSSQLQDVAGGGSSYLSKSTRLVRDSQAYPSIPQREEHDAFHQSMRADYNSERPLPSCEPHTAASILPQPTSVHSAQSPNRRFSITPPHHSLRRDLTIGHSQIERISPPEHQLDQPLSYQSLSHSAISAASAFYGAHNFIIKDSAFIDNSSISDSFMASLLKETIPGAEFDSSDPNMPVRCHPGTRLEVIKRCQDFVLDRAGRPKIRWVVGAAGVGKSAVMQSVAHDESNILSVAAIIVGATIFFSINGRQDGTKAITTIAYQLAVKLRPYRLFLQREVADDPSLLRKSLSVQFKRFIVEPFINRRIPDCPSCLLIIIDGLDECANPSTQLELLGLVSNLCITYPDSPLIWMIASRPEPHIASFFSQPEIAPPHDMEQILVDSDEAHEDVKRYLWDKFREIQIASFILRRLPQWPSEDNFSKIAEASGGLFAYASTVIRYIGEPTHGDPVGQLDDVLEIIETGTCANVYGENHPMARLDALYACIMSRIPAKVLANARKLLLLYVRPTYGWNSLHFVCNLLRMTVNDAYAAIHPLRAVANIPGLDEALHRNITFFHKSFLDYLQDFNRSGFFSAFESEAEDLLGQCGLRIIGEAPDGVQLVGATKNDFAYVGGALKYGPGSGDNVSVSWPAVGEDNNRKLRLNMYREAVWIILKGLERREEAFRSLLCLRVLTTCFDVLPDRFPFGALSDSVFDECRRRELLDHGIIKEVPLGTLANDHRWRYKFMRLHFSSTTLSDSWNASCQHEREGNWEGPGQDWSTNAIVRRMSSCTSCVQRLRRHLKIQSPDYLVTVCDLTRTDVMVELRFIDPDDGVSEWLYHFAIYSHTTDDKSGEKGYIKEEWETEEEEQAQEKEDEEETGRGGNGDRY